MSHLFELSPGLPQRIVARCLVTLAGIGLSSVALAEPVVYEPASDPGLGFNLIAWSGSSGTSWSNAIDALYTSGYREVSISPVRRFNNNTGAVITNAGYPPLSAVEAGVARAKQLGMRVTLNPFVELSNLPAAANGWRAYFAPLPGSTVANTFWPQYETYLDEVAAIAQQHQVDAMNVGTEMKGLDSLFSITDFDPATPGNQSSPTQAQLIQQKSYWTNVIDSVASIYGGAIGYAANWDNFNSTRVTSNIWSHPAIDYIGIDSYFRFTASPYQIPDNAAVPVQSYPDEGFVQLVATEWNQRLDGQILPFARSIGKPVVFTEQGYQHHNRTSQNPQIEPTPSDPVPVDTAEQIMAFEGLLRALDGRQDEFLAMHIWQWEMAGSQGSTWNINPAASANQPDNRPLAWWLSGWVRNLLPGDYNDDGQVDAADYVVWRKLQGSSVTYFDRADGNGSGHVDDIDFALWQKSFGATSASGSAVSASVPEPAACYILLAVTGCIWCLRSPKLAERSSWHKAAGY